jgi:two-component system, chemotaxis family, chemotaxis protein CheY
MKMHALVVDDARAMRSILRKVLEGIGLEVTTVASGAEGLETLMQIDPPDVMLIDWNMPEMNGLELLQAVRANSDYDAIRIMTCTTETDVKYVTQAIQAGANEYIMKPFTEDVLREKLRLAGAEMPQPMA